MEMIRFSYAFKDDIFIFLSSSYNNRACHIYEQRMFLYVRVEAFLYNEITVKGLHMFQ